MVTASQLRNGMAIQFESQDYKVISAEYHPGQGKMGGVAHVRLRNLATGTFWEHSFRAEQKLATLPMERHEMEFLYADGDQYVFMNPQTYEQVEIAKELAGPQTALLEPGMNLSVEFVEGRPVSVLFPPVLEVKIADTAPATHQQADSAYKPARLPNGVEVMVPQFVKAGDVIRMDLETMRYVDRAKTKNA